MIKGPSNRQKRNIKRCNNKQDRYNVATGNFILYLYKLKKPVFKNDIFSHATLCVHANYWEAYKQKLGNQFKEIYFTYCKYMFIQFCNIVRTH